VATCPVCATDNADVARFCMACGAALTPQVPGREARKVVTVVFADITGSTGLGERLDPETLRSIMGRWFEAMRAVLERHDASVEKFIGDAVVAVFGVPVVHEDDALRAVRAAAEMQDALVALNEILRAERGLAIEMRVGVNTGVVVVGDARAGGSRATGDAVNVAARLQQVAEPGETLLGDSTWRLVREAVTTGEARNVEVKGRDEAVVVRRLLSVDQTAEAIHRHVGGPMIGRDRELGILRTAFERAVAEERCVLVTILGSAGVGKSRLVHEFLSDARHDAEVLRGRCLPYGHGITWHPIVELLRSAVGLDEMAEPADVIDGLRHRLAGVDDADQILGRLAEPLGSASEPIPLEEVFWAVRRFLERLASDRPLVLVLDDLQWAEAALLEGALISPPARARIATAADGNPLYVEQVIEMLLDDGLVQREADGSLVIGDLESISVPPTIQALLAARLDRLSDGERRTIERAAVVGKEFGQRDVSELTPAEGRANVTSQLMGLVRKELIRPDRRRDTSGDTYRFRHLLIRDAAYDSLPKLERAELHERFADWLEETAGDRLAELDEIAGYHLDQARTYRLALGPEDDRTRALALRAGRRLGAAGRRAAERDEVSSAVRLLSQAEALLVEDPALRFELLIVMMEAGHDLESATIDAWAKQAVGVSAQLGELTQRRAHLWMQGIRGFWDPTFHLSDLREEAAAAVRDFEAAGDVDAVLDALQISNWIDLNAAHWADAAASAQRGLELATNAGREARRDDFVDWLANAVAWGSTSAVDGLALYESLLPTVRRRLSRASLFAFAALLRGILGDAAGAEAAQGEATAIWDELGYRRLEFRHAYTRFALEDLEGALVVIAAEIAALEQRGETGTRSTMVGLRAWTLALLGRDAEAAFAASESRQLGASDDAVTQILWRAAESVVLARRGEGVEADRISLEGVRIADATDSWDAGTAWYARAQVLSILGRRTEAVDAARRSREVYVAKGFVNGIRRVDALLAALAR
jgi:class 3 adenylate cyclase